MFPGQRQVMRRRNTPHSIHFWLNWSCVARATNSKLISGEFQSKIKITYQKLRVICIRMRRFFFFSIPFWATKPHFLSLWLMQISHNNFPLNWFIQWKRFLSGWNRSMGKSLSNRIENAVHLMFACTFRIDFICNEKWIQKCWQTWLWAAFCIFDVDFSEKKENDADDGKLFAHSILIKQTQRRNKSSEIFVSFCYSFSVKCLHKLNGTFCLSACIFYRFEFFMERNAFDSAVLKMWIGKEIRMRSYVSVSCSEQNETAECSSCVLNCQWSVPEIVFDRNKHSHNELKWRQFSRRYICPFFIDPSQNR